MRAPTLREFFAFLVALLGAAGGIMVLMMLCLASAAKAEPMILTYQSRDVGVAVLTRNTQKVGDLLLMESLTVFRRPIGGADFLVRRDAVRCSDMMMADKGLFVWFTKTGRVVKKSLEAGESSWYPLKETSELYLAALGECLGVRPKEAMIDMNYREAVEAFRKEAP